MQSCPDLFTSVRSILFLYWISKLIKSSKHVCFFAAIQFFYAVALADYIIEFRQTLSMMMIDFGMARQLDPKKNRKLFDEEKREFSRLLKCYTV